MKVTTPKVLEVPDAAEMVSFVVLLEARVTVFPETGLEFASSKVTVIVEVVVPLAAILEALAVIVERVGLGGPQLKVTVGCWVITVLLSVTSVAV